MTKKQFTALSEYSLSLTEAKAGYYRAITSSTVDKLIEIYKELGYHAGKNERTCSRCILGMLLNLAKEYDKYEADAKAKAEAKAEAKAKNKTKPEE